MKRAVNALIAGGLAVLAFGSTVDAQAPGDDVEVMIAIDASESMQPAIEEAKAAAVEFVAAMPSGVRIGVLTFADSVVVLTGPTTDRSLVDAQIASIATGGDTALYDAVVTAVDQFTPDAEQRVLVLLSDGKDEGSVAPLQGAVAAVRGMHVESISLTTPNTDVLSLFALGPVTAAEDAAGLASAFARVADLVVEVIEPTTVPTTAAPAPTTTATVPATTVAAVVVTTPPAAPEPAVVAVSEPASSASSAWLWLGGAGLFVGLFVLALLVFPEDHVSKARLGIDKPRHVSDIGARTVSAIEEALERYGRRADLGAALTAAAISMKPAEFVATVAVVAVVAGLFGLLLGGPLVALAVMVAVCLGARFYVRRTKSKRQAAFADQLPDVLQLVTTALRSGYGITQALESVAEEAEEPARSEFARAIVEARLGRNLSEAMHDLAQRMGSKDLEWVVAAIEINRETGGNLSEILHSVGATVRDRGQMARQVRTLTAEGRLSARILTAVPLLMLLWQWRINPDNVELLTHGVGLVALVIAACLMALGAAWVHRIVHSVSL